MWTPPIHIPFISFGLGLLLLLFVFTGLFVFYSIGCFQPGDNELGETLLVYFINVTVNFLLYFLFFHCNV